MSEYDQPIESLPSYEESLPGNDFRPLIKKIFMAFIFLLLCSSVGLNVHLYRRPNLNVSNLSGKELKEKQFFDENRNDIDTLVFKGGSTEEGVVMHETPTSVLFKFVDGTTEYNRSDIEHILYDTYRKDSQNDVSSNQMLLIGIVLGLALVFLAMSLCLNLVFYIHLKKPSKKHTQPLPEPRETEVNIPRTISEFQRPSNLPSNNGEAA